MNRDLSAAVLATFHDDTPGDHRERLRGFSVRQWQRNFHWLDSSGIALYFLQRIKTLGVEDAVPNRVVAQLERRYSDNGRRIASLFGDFAKINAAFQSAHIEYVNLKGFTLVPDYCPDLSLRYQVDSDFLVSEQDSQRSAQILERLGYVMVAGDQKVMEFKTGIESIPKVGDLYKPKPQRSAEVHICRTSRSDSRDNPLQRSRQLSMSGICYPALSSEDMFLAQAAHIFRHVRSEWTRISWLLEFKYFVVSHRENAAFWKAIRERAVEDPEHRVAIGVAIRLAEGAFGHFAPNDLKDRTVAGLPKPVCLWIERFGTEVLLTDFPGSKLYLILEQELASSNETARMVRRRIFPLRLPGRIMAVPSCNTRQRLLAVWFQWRYLFFRLRFHLVQSSRYLLEAHRWKYFLKRSATYDWYRHAGYVANAKANDDVSSAGNSTLVSSSPVIPQ